MTPAQRILDRLDGVKTSGQGHAAKCPAHEDKSPSLSITETDQGSVLIHCFAGCETASVLDAIGLSLGDLFADKLPPAHQSRPERGQLSAEDLLMILDRASSTVWIAAENIAHGVSLTDEDLAAVAKARTAIAKARAVFRGRA